MNVSQDILSNSFREHVDECDAIKHVSYNQEKRVISS